MPAIESTLDPGNKRFAADARAMRERASRSAILATTIILSNGSGLRSETTAIELPTIGNEIVATLVVGHEVEASYPPLSAAMM